MKKENGYFYSTPIKNKLIKKIKVFSTCICEKQNLIFVSKVCNSFQNKIHADVKGLTASLFYFRKNETPNKEILKSIFIWLGFKEEDPFLKSAIDLAKKADKMTKNKYHNGDHLRDVTILTFNLLITYILRKEKINRILSTKKECFSIDRLVTKKEKEMMALILIAAVSHDLNHDGVGNKRIEKNNQYIPFFLEKKSSDIAKKVLIKNGIDLNLINILQAIIYTTDPIDGYKILKNPTLIHSYNIKKNIALQLKKKNVIHMAYLLRDADILGSSGLTQEFINQQTKRLSEEIKFDIKPQQTNDFLTKMVGFYYSKECQIFNNSLKKIIKNNKEKIANAIKKFKN